MADLKVAVDLGCFFSIGPPMLDTSNGRRLVAAIPRSQVLTETDGPFVQEAGVPARPGHVRGVLEGLANVWKVDVSRVDSQVTANSLRIFAAHNLPRNLVT
jgi:TatD DNase family protein